MKATLEEKRTWVRMGWELAALEKLAAEATTRGNQLYNLTERAEHGS